MKVDFKKQNERTFEIFCESKGLSEANFLRPLAKLCVQGAGRTLKKITEYFYQMYINRGVIKDLVIMLGYFSPVLKKKKTNNMGLHRSASILWRNKKTTS